MLSAAHEHRTADGVALSMHSHLRKLLRPQPWAGQRLAGALRRQRPYPNAALGTSEPATQNIIIYAGSNSIISNKTIQVASIQRQLLTLVATPGSKQLADPGSINMELPPSLLAVQNMVQLCKELKVPVTYKVHEVLPKDTSHRSFSVVVHVHADHAFKKYLTNCASTDLMLYRGLLLMVRTSHDARTVQDAWVQQAFLPKFENEGQDSSIADAIVQQADDRYMVVTIKHSGSLVTLSASGFAAKNSVGNEYTAGAAVLLRAHYDRLFGPAQGAARLAAFMQLLRDRHMAVSFEMVTGCHGHHGQLPAGEYLVATAAHMYDEASGRPAFLGSLDFLSFCLEQGLPINDTWLFMGQQHASAARVLLDDLALAGGITGLVLPQLTTLVQDGTSTGCLHVPGTYPHDQWQGSRLEGFVVSQGQPFSPTLHQALTQLSQKAVTQQISLASCQGQLHNPYRDTVAHFKHEAVADAAARTAAGAKQHAHKGKEPKLESLAPDAPMTEAVKSEVLQHILHQQRGWLPSMELASVDNKAALIDALHSAKPPNPIVRLPNGELICSRTALAHAKPEQLPQVVQAAVQTLQQAGRQPAEPQQVQQLLHDLQSGSHDKLHNMRMKLPRLLMGAPDIGNTLRYKKKMMLWHVARSPAAPSTTPKPMDTGDSSTPPPPTPAPVPAANESGVGYCMMTFIIRNGLVSLKLGLSQYLNYVAHQARNWGLAEAQVAQVLMFAQAWAAWVQRQGGVSTVHESQYLHIAEPFVSFFLQCMASGDMTSLMGERPKTAFHGILVLLDEPSKTAAEQIKKALAATNFLEVHNAKTKIPPYGKSLVSQGMVVWVAPGFPVPRDVLDLLSAAGPSGFCAVVQKGAPAGTGGDAKRARSISDENRAKAERAIRAGNVAPTLPHLKLLHYDYTEQDVVQWVGSGVPARACDPAAICCFVSIPGVGKTALTDRLSGLPGLDPNTPLKVQVLNSDKMKQQPGFANNRYWHFVANAADSSTGGVTVVVADKNLCPSPVGNVQRVCATIKDSGAVTVAVVPSWRGKPQWDVGVPFPTITWPLELVALCMLRTLLRKNHEGQLDASLDKALRVLVMFVLFYKNKTYADLMDLCRSQFAVVAQLPVIDLDATDPNKQVPLELLQHIAWGLANYNEKSKDGLPAEWEKKARDMLLQKSTIARLQSLQVSLEESQRCLADTLMDGLKEAQALAAGNGLGGTALSLQPAAAAAAGTSSGNGTACRAMSIDGSQQAAVSPAVGNPGRGNRVRFIAIQVDGAVLKSTAQSLLPDLDLRKLKTEFHVTLWHSADPVMGKDYDMRDALMAGLGSVVEMQVVSIDYIPGKIAAAQVQLLDAPEAAFSKPYHHITLYVGQGVQAKDANQLPDMVDRGVAQRVTLEEPLMLTGPVCSFM